MNKELKVTRQDLISLNKTLTNVVTWIDEGQYFAAEETLKMLINSISRSIGKVELKEFIGSFGAGQKQEGTCQPIMAESYGMARKIMFGLYGEEWGFMYTRDEWEKWGREAKLVKVPIEKELLTYYQKEVIK